jgi:hypothetical protein
MRTAQGPVVAHRQAKHSVAEAHKVADLLSGFQCLDGHRLRRADQVILRTSMACGPAAECGYVRWKCRKRADDSVPWLGDTCLADSLEYTRLFQRVVRLNATMNVAGAERLARRLHQGEIDGNGAAYVDHLARVAALVAAEGGSRAQLMAAWLVGTARTGARPGDLARYGVPGPVIGIVDALTPRQPWEEAPSWAGRVKSCRPAVVVLRACVTDLTQASLLRRGPYHAARLRALLDLTGIEIPAVLSDREAGSRPATPAAVRLVPLERLAADDPGRWDALAVVSAARDPRAAGSLLEAYLAARAGDPRWSGGRARLAGALTAMALRRLNQVDPEWVTFLRRLAGHQDEFLRATAVRGLAGLPGDQERLHTALADPGPLVAGAALDSLTSAEGAADSLAAIASQYLSATAPVQGWPASSAVPSAPASPVAHT